METFASLYNQVLYNLDESGDTGTTLQLVKNFINQAHHHRCTQDRWPFMLWPQQVTFSTVVNQETYSLHPEFSRPLYFFNRTTSTYLTEIPWRQLQNSGALWNTDNGSADQFFLEGLQPVANQPASTSTLSIVSTSGTDNSSTYNLTVRGMTANGVTSETITPNGLTPVSTVNSYSVILNVTKAAAWNGTMTMTSDNGATTNVVLFPSELGRNHIRFFLTRLPNQAETIEYRFFRKPTVLANDDDIPDIPFPFSNILVWDALLLFGGYNSDADPQSIAMWTQKRDQIQEAMEHTFQDGQSLGAMPRFVRDMTEAGTGRVRVIG